MLFLQQVWPLAEHAYLFSVYCFLYVFMTFCEYNITYSLKHQDKETFTAYMRMYRKYVFIAPLDFQNKMADEESADDVTSATGPDPSAAYLLLILGSCASD